MLKYFSHLKIFNLRKHYDMIPLFSALTFACSFGIWYTAYCALAKSDVRWDLYSELAPHERIDATKKQKLYVVSQEYKPLDELEKAKAKIGPM